MIKAKHSWFWLGFFNLYGQFMQKTHFRKISVISNDVFTEGSSVVLLQNHFSKWDGYWSLYLSKTIFNRKFHAMMLEEHLSKRMFLTKCGVFSIRKNSREAIESLRYTEELLNDPENLVTIYPSGELLSQHRQNFSFQKGFVRVTENKKSQPIIAFAVVLVDFFGFARPEVRIYLTNYFGKRTAEALEKEYHSFYESCVTKQTE